MKIEIKAPTSAQWSGRMLEPGMVEITSAGPALLLLGLQEEPITITNISPADTVTTVSSVKTRDKLLYDVRTRDKILSLSCDVTNYIGLA